MVTRASEVLAEVDVQDRDLVRRVLEAAVLGIGSSVVVTEYAKEISSNGFHVWPSEDKHFLPVANRIKAVRDDFGRVFRRTVIVVDDWAEVTEP
jgi:hypothetical protein